MVTTRKPAAKKTATKRAASRSGNPATRATAKPQVSGVGDFKKKVGGVFELPSGARMQLRNPGGLKIFVQQGVIPNSLMGIVNEALAGDTLPDMNDVVKDGKVDPQLMDDMMQLMDACLVACAVSPAVEFAPETEGDRLDDHLYVDEVVDEDKMFIFQWVSGGTSDVAQFRAEQASELVALQPSKGTRRPTKRAPSRR